MVLGWVGAACSLLAYWTVSTQRVAPDSLRYHALNMVACALLAVACLVTRAWPSVVTNLIFIVIGVRMTWQVRDRLVLRLRGEWAALAARSTRLWAVRQRVGRPQRFIRSQISVRSRRSAHAQSRACVAEALPGR
jgi:hypothetical protein